MTLTSDSGKRFLSKKIERISSISPECNEGAVHRSETYDYQCYSKSDKKGAKLVLTGQPEKNTISDTDTENICSDKLSHFCGSESTNCGENDDEMVNMELQKMRLKHKHVISLVAKIDACYAKQAALGSCGASVSTNVGFQTVDHCDNTNTETSVPVTHDKDTSTSPVVNVESGSPGNLNHVPNSGVVNEVAAHSIDTFHAVKSASSFASCLVPEEPTVNDIPTGSVSVDHLIKEKEHRKVSIDPTSENALSIKDASSVFESSIGSDDSKSYEINNTTGPEKVDCSEFSADLDHHSNSSDSENLINYNDSEDSDDSGTSTSSQSQDSSDSFDSFGSGDTPDNSKHLSLSLCEVDRQACASFRGSILDTDGYGVLTNRGTDDELQEAFAASQGFYKCNSKLRKNTQKQLEVLSVDHIKNEGPEEQVNHYSYETPLSFDRLFKATPGESFLPVEHDQADKSIVAPCDVSNSAPKLFPVLDAARRCLSVDAGRHQQAQANLCNAPNGPSTEHREKSKSCPPSIENTLELLDEPSNCYYSDFLTCKRPALSELESNELSESCCNTKATESLHFQELCPCDEHPVQEEGHEVESVPLSCSIDRTISPNADIYDDITPTEPLNLSSFTVDKTSCHEEVMAKKIDLSPYEYYPGNTSCGFDWSPYNPNLKLSTQTSCNEITAGAACEIENNSDSGTANESDDTSKSGIESDDEDDIYYKYQNESDSSISEMQRKVTQRLTRRGIKKRQRLFPDKHGIHYEKLHFHRPYKTPTFGPSNSNPYLDQFIPSIVNQRKLCAAKRLKKDLSALEDFYRVPTPGKIKFGDTEVIKFDMEGEIVPLEGSLLKQTRNSIEELKSILKSSRKESPGEWETLIGNNALKNILARIFNICNIPLTFLNEGLEAALEKVAAAIIVESGNKEYCANYQSLYDEVKFEEHSREMKNKIKDLKMRLDESLEEKKRMNTFFEQELGVYKEKLISQRKEFEDKLISQREEFERTTAENFEEFEQILMEDRKSYEKTQSKERESYEKLARTQQEEHTKALNEEREVHCMALKEERERHELFLAGERERVDKVESTQSTLFNNAVEEYRIRELIALEQANSLRADVERKRIENGKLQNQMNSLTMQNDQLKKSIKEQCDLNSRLKHEKEALRLKLSQYDYRKNSNKDRFIAAYQSLGVKKKELKDIKTTNRSLLAANKEMKDLILKLQTALTDTKEHVEDCKENIEVIQSRIISAKRAHSQMDKQYQDLNKNFLTLANAHFPLQSAYKVLLASFDDLKKNYKETCRENQRKERDLKRANEHLIRANDKVRQARKTAKGEFIYLAEEEDDYSSVIHMPLEFLQDKEVAPTPTPVPTSRFDPHILSNVKVPPIPVNSPTEFPRVDGLCVSPSKRGTKRKILRSLANKMSLSNHTYDDRRDLFAAA